MSTPNFQSVLIVAAHPDDEVLGCGGTAARHVAEGSSVAVQFLSDGETARGSHLASKVQSRKDAARQACSALGIDQIRFGDFSDNQLDSIPMLQVVQVIETAISKYQPDLVYTHHRGDVNIDHEIANRAVLTACRPLPNSSVTCIRAFEVLSSTEWATASFTPSFQPNLYVDISKHLSRKLAVMQHYADELRPFPHSRSTEGIEALARYRGISAGVAAAEAFFVEREII
ncbi:MAG: PIG-L deacetylase family protein [Pseudomonadota bacterium]